ncbi:serine hydrolase domain-containing protein [Streptosporangium sp. NPDC051023]|uniref:serine hydrolase domain-containing protein n=1 Tax=Streptosporangium sp. NPDC051023 TaxID=3155410 RepID=UPI00344BC177
MSGGRRSSRRIGGLVAAGAVGAALVVTAVVPAGATVGSVGAVGAVVSEAGNRTVTSAKDVGSGGAGDGGQGASSRCDHSGTQRLLDALTRAEGVPGATAEVTGPGCGTWRGTSGTADREHRRPVRGGERFRIGSVTKTFTATVVLQLAAEGRLDLDAPVERYLPGVVNGRYDGGSITVRGLLRHTSGLPDYVSGLDWDNVAQWRLDHHSDRELVNVALALPSPGDGWHYSNTNYVLAGMIVEKVTGKDIGTEITRRVVKRLGLNDTYWPGDATGLRGRHLRGYTPVGDGLVDVTDFNPTVAGASGALVSTTHDLNRFFAALLGGRLLPPAQLAEMRETVPADPARLWPGGEYGLGLASAPLSCGGRWWGHRGSFLGYRTLSAVTQDGRQVTISLNQYELPASADRAVLQVAQTALCETR